MIEPFKIKYDLAPPIMNSMLNRRAICCNVRNLQEFQSERKRTGFYGLETLSLCKSSVRQWICNECPCRLCKGFVPNPGSI